MQASYPLRGMGESWGSRSVWSWEFALWTLLHLGLRALMVIALADVFFYGEELEKGAAAKALIDGLDVAHHKLAYHYYEGGGFLITHLKALAFLAVGQNLLAHKLCGLLTCWLVFAAMWRLLDAHVGRSAARWGALLLTFSPLALQRISLLSLGIHYESMALGLLLLDEGLRVLRAETPSRGRLLRVGVIAGFALFFSYQSVLVIGWVGLMVLLRRPRVVFSSTGLAGFAGLGLGALPLAYMGWHVGAKLLDIHGTSLTATGSNAERVVRLGRSLFLEAPVWPRAVAWFYLVAGCLGVGLALFPQGERRGERRGAALYLLGFGLLWVLAWYLGPFVPEGIGHWFAWLRFAPFAVVVVALSAAGAAARGGLVPCGVALVAVALGVTGSVRALLQGQPGTPLANVAMLRETKGYDYRGYFKMLMGHLGEDAEPVPGQPRPSVDEVRPILGYDEPERGLLLADLAARWFEDERIHMELQAQLAALDGLGEERAAMLRGMGASVLVAAQARFDPPKALASLAHLDEPLRSQLAEAVGYSSSAPELAPGLVSLVRSCANSPLAEPFLRGAGARFYRNLVVSPYGQERLLNAGAIRAMILDELPDQAGPMLAGFDAEQNRWTLP